MTLHRVGNDPHSYPAFVSVDGLRAIAGIGRTSIYKAMKEGRFPIRKMGTRTLIQTAGALAWLDALPTYSPDKGAIRPS